MLTRHLAKRNLIADRFGTICAVLGVALGTATVNVVLILDVNTQSIEARRWSTNPALDVELAHTVLLQGRLQDGTPTVAEDAAEETHEDYQVMRSAIRLGSLSAFGVGALIVFFTFGVVVERRKREIALLRSLGALPRQVAAIFVAEAAVIGVAGGAIGYVAAVPMSVAAAFAGITTTGRAQIYWMRFPWTTMLIVAAIGASCALLGVLRPALGVLRMDVAATLAPRFVNEPHNTGWRLQLTPLTLPFVALLYVLMRPFFSELLPSLAFFVFEAAAVSFGFLSALVLVPDVVRWLGTAAARVLPKGRGLASQHLIVTRRVTRMGETMAWSIGGVMLVFGLVLALHVVTHALEREVNTWAEGAVRPYTFVYRRGRHRLPPLPRLPKRVAVAQFSSRTPWPNSVYSVPAAQLVALSEATGDQRTIAMAKRLGPGRTIVSTMMARRFRLSVGDRLEVTGGDGAGLLEVVAVTDDVGYVPAVGPYRNSKTYALIDAADHHLIAHAAGPIGAAVALADPDAVDRAPAWRGDLAGLDARRGVFVETGRALEAERVRETNRDFAIFDLILLLTTLLAAIGIANNLVLSIHGRRREIALYRVLGMTSGQVRSLFLLEGVLVGLLGGPLAVLLGAALGYAAVQALGAVSAFEVRFHLPASYAVATIAGAIAVALLASLYPAGTAASASSAESVHYE